jgi:hypothetical protein
MGTLLNAALMLLTALVANSGVLWHTTTAAGRFTPAAKATGNTTTNVSTSAHLGLTNAHKPH